MQLDREGPFGRICRFGTFPLDHGRIAQVVADKPGVYVLGTLKDGDFRAGRSGSSDTLSRRLAHHAGEAWFTHFEFEYTSLPRGTFFAESALFHRLAVDWNFDHPKRPDRLPCPECGWGWGGAIPWDRISGRTRRKNASALPHPASFGPRICAFASKQDVEAWIGKTLTWENYYEAAASFPLRKDINIKRDGPAWHVQLGVSESWWKSHRETEYPPFVLDPWSSTIEQSSVSVMRWAAASPTSELYGYVQVILAPRDRRYPPKFIRPYQFPPPNCTVAAVPRRVDRYGRMSSTSLQDS